MQDLYKEAVPLETLEFIHILSNTAQRGARLSQAAWSVILFLLARRKNASIRPDSVEVRLAQLAMDRIALCWTDWSV